MLKWNLSSRSSALEYESESVNDDAQALIGSESIDQLATSSKLRVHLRIVANRKAVSG